MKLKPKFKRIKKLVTSPTGRLAGSYLLIIMLLCIGFSTIFYYASSYQLGRQLPPDALLHQENKAPPAGSAAVTTGDHHDTPKGDIGQFLHKRIDEGRRTLKYRLLYLNLGSLVVGSLISVYLARRTLRPIEQAIEAQVHFVNDASHELRTPLTAIKAGNDVALRNPKLTLKDAKRVIAQNSEDAEQLKALSDGLLTLAKNDDTDFVQNPVNLQEVVSHAMTQIIQQASAKDIAVHDEVANSSVLAYQTALEQVLVILLDNAVKYSHAKGNIYLKTRQKGKKIYLDVVDEGIGIKSSDLPHLFRRFYRADHSRTGGETSGYGLGLSIAERIMKNLDGSISVNSKIGEGSTFSLKLNLG